MKAPPSGTRGAAPAETRPGDASWTPSASGYRRSELSRRVRLGGSPAEAPVTDADWSELRRLLLGWAVKTRSGFAVRPARPVAPGQRLDVIARVPGARVVEPVEIVEVVDREDRVGFAYRTRPGHPVSGEEAFVLQRSDGGVVLTVRSLTRAAPSGPWRAAYPLLRVVQIVVRYRYLRSLDAR
ncbi:DUF1990 family protein [Mycetocola reblochoni]|uniref:A3(2) GLYCOGEN METABOLISM CLUSTERI n=2 Tax=Mycetocola reblochoni TaxID=331618 RepID=A0A1R4J146_9MICO|nr:DUF1990 family protein [Mycetocola reblochoni]RLP71208.1 DUF1990 family protein [Mycetocola reblochoni]SJN25759.1 A3(2) GLYCOGEN METABOLISM CLUSTERI [Mycetocola reblochoni REB411]